MEYITTKYKCQKSINGVCSHCGGALEPLETVDNSGSPTYWSGCKTCSRFDSGVDPAIYEIAKKLVVDHGFKYYSHIQDKLDDPEEIKQYNEQCQISGSCYVASLIKQMLD